MGSRTILKYANLTIELLPYIVKLISWAERVFSGSGRGPEKKDAVVNAVDAVTPADTGEEFKEAVGGLIDIVVPLVVKK